MSVPAPGDLIFVSDRAVHLAKPDAQPRPRYLADRFREQARSHNGSLVDAGLGSPHPPCGSEHARDGAVSANTAIACHTAFASKPAPTMDRWWTQDWAHLNSPVGASLLSAATCRSHWRPHVGAANAVTRRFDSDQAPNAIQRQHRPQMSPPTAFRGHVGPAFV